MNGVCIPLDAEYNVAMTNKNLATSRRTPAKAAFGKRLRAWRKARDLTAKAFSEMLDVTEKRLYQWEGGVAAPNVDELAHMREKASVSMDYLIGGDDSMVPKSIAETIAKSEIEDTKD